MNKPVVIMIVILLIIGAIAINKIMTPQDTTNSPSQVSQQGTNINYPPNNTTNTTNTSTNTPFPKPYVQQK